MTGNEENLRRIKELLGKIYSQKDSNEAFDKLTGIIEQFRGKIGNQRAGLALDQSDAILITYGDMVRREGEEPLQTLRKFLLAYAHNIVTTVHILPFFPFSSDDGFSVIDFRQVNPDLGDWETVVQIGQDFKLMVDLVVNHISVKSQWFQNYLKGIPPFTDYFIEVDPDADLSQVFRPRALPLLKKVMTASGEKLVWTTFSADQADLNYADYRVLLEIVNILLFYVAKSARFIRLDAIAYIWKEIGSRCIHLQEVHWIIQILRRVLDAVAPSVILVSETNVAHTENVSYFGDGTNEAQMVYNFSLPPLVLHAFQSGSAKRLSLWVDGLSLPSSKVTFFNFLASHDGIGLTPLKGILEDSEIDELARYIETLGGHVSYKTNPDGTESPYELNINYYDALTDSKKPSKSEGDQINRFLCAHAIMFALRGVPGIYFHSLFGSTGWPAGVEKTGQPRTNNREKLYLTELNRGLEQSASRRSQIYSRMSGLLKVRKKCDAFAPQSPQQILFLDDRLFSLIRRSTSEKNEVICIHNVTSENVNIRVNFQDFGVATGRYTRLAGEGTLSSLEDSIKISLPAYTFLWAGAA